MANKLREITFRHDPDEMIWTEYGVVAYRTWCERECERINRAGRRVWIDADAAGRICVVSGRKPRPI